MVITMRSDNAIVGRGRITGRPMIGWYPGELVRYLACGRSARCVRWTPSPGRTLSVCSFGTGIALSDADLVHVARSMPASG